MARKPRETSTPGTALGVAGERYEAHKASMAARSAAMSRAGREVGPLPKVGNPKRRAACRRNLRKFLEAYFPNTFPLEWSEDHLRVMEKIEKAVLEGGLSSYAMPRGSGKTSILEGAGIWAGIYGHREFIVIVGATELHADEILSSIKAELESNELLAEDFPEVVYPISRLEGIANRAAGQTLDGKPTRIGWTKKDVTFPTVPRKKSSGVTIRVAGITGRIRGMKHKRHDGRSVRPSLVLIDDPQTDESARSPSQCQAREATLAGAVLGLAGPGEKIAGLMAVTVIRRDDMADRLLDPEKHPAWQGERTRMVYSFPTNKDLWAKYAKLREDGLRAGVGLEYATEFYGKNREAMDEGSRVAWAPRFNHDELSAIQHAMNLKLHDEAAFWAEYQNEPLDLSGSDVNVAAEPDAIVEKLSGVDRGVVPDDVDHLTAFVDVQEKVLFWLVAGWTNSFTGYVVDYGVFPDQRAAPGEPFTLGNLKRTLAQTYPGAGFEGSLYKGLGDLANLLLGREWSREDGSVERLSKLLVDANWGRSTDTVYQFARRSPFASSVSPAHGRYVGAGSRPFSEGARRQSEKFGLNWRSPAPKGKRKIRHVTFDANFWKTFVHSRVKMPLGEPGGISLFGSDPRAHDVFAAHLTAEYSVRTSGRGREVDEWKIKVGRPDNHWLDCLVGSAVAASMLGSAPIGGGGLRKPKAKIRLSDIQRGRA